MSDLPDSWDDEPWPLDDPTPVPSFQPSNWSDTHDAPPQVADLADEAWEYALDHGVSMERALAELQDRRMAASGTYAKYAGGATVLWVPATQQTIDDANHAARRMDELWSRVRNALATGNPAVSMDRLIGDALLDQLKRDPMPRRTLDQWSFTRGDQDQ